MRYIGLLLLLITVFSMAEEPPPAPQPPRMMNIHFKDGTADRIPCSLVHPTAGASFVENGTIMKLTLVGASIKWYSTNFIDSITFTPIVVPVPAE